MSKKRLVVVIGGGAAGYFGAIAAAEGASAVKVLLLEASSRSLAKVAISGGGRCNVTHNLFDPKAFTAKYPRGGRELMGPFSRFQAKDTIGWFASRGVRLKAERDGRMFPVTDTSSTIVECLQHAAATAGVEIRHRCKVTAIEPISGTEQRFALSFEAGGTTERILVDSVLLASGSASRGYELAQGLRHTIQPTVPSLFTFEISDRRLEGLSGVSVPNAELRLRLPGAKIAPERGPVLITHWGLSGPGVIKLSAWAARPLHDAAYRAELIVSWLPDRTAEELLSELREFKDANAKRQVQTSVHFGLPKRLWASLVENSGINESTPWSTVSKQQLAALVRELLEGSYTITGKGVFKEEFVTCGGVTLKEVDFRRMESKLTPGLFFAGEILDIDGLTGGFNFQAAWTTSWLAGKAIAAECEQ